MANGLGFLFDGSIPRTHFAELTHRWQNRYPVPVRITARPGQCKPGRVLEELRLVVQADRDLPPDTHLALDVPFRMRDHKLTGPGRDVGARYVTVKGHDSGCRERLTVFGRVSALMELILGGDGLLQDRHLELCIGHLGMPCRPGTYEIPAYGRLPGGKFGPAAESAALKLQHGVARNLAVYARPTANNVPFAVSLAAEQARMASFMPAPDHTGTARLTMPGRVQVVSVQPENSGARRITMEPPETDGPFQVEARERQSGRHAASNLVHPGIVPPEYDLFFGDLHVHSGFSDGFGKHADLLHLARDWQCLDFMGFNDHIEPGLSTRQWTPERWAEVKAAIDGAMEPGRFVAFGGLELNRHVNLWSRGDQYTEFVLEHEEEWSSTLDRVTRLAAANCWLVGYHGFERLEKILGHLPPPVHLLQIAERGKEEDVSLFLARGDRTGFFAATDTHLGLPGRPPAGRERGAPAGLTAVLAPELTREAVFDALRARHCYATMGTRHLVWFEANGRPMGEELWLAPGTAVQLKLRAAGCEHIERVELWRNGAVARSVFFGRQKVTLEEQDVVPERGSTSWHVRIVLEDGRLIWTSPVWLMAEVSG